MTVDWARYNDLRERIESGDAIPKEKEEWVRIREAEIRDFDERLREPLTEFDSASEQWVARAVNDLRERTRNLVGRQMVDAGPAIWADFKRQWGEEWARKAWMDVVPQRRQGIAKWRQIPGRRPRGRPQSDADDFQDFTLEILADLHATQPNQKGVTVSQEEAAEAVLGEGTVDPKEDAGRQIRRIKGRNRARRAIRD